MISFSKGTIEFSLPDFSILNRIKSSSHKYFIAGLLTMLSIISVGSFLFYLNNHLGLAYNDARSHLDIGRRVVEGLKPGLAQLGSVWLPLPHILMIPTIWNDFMWHTGLSGALVSMISFVFTGILIYKFLETLEVNLIGRIVALFIFVANINILYMQSTAMTELLLLATMTAASYELLKWQKTNKYLYLITSSFWIMLATLVRYDGWFLFAYASMLIIILTFKKYKYKQTEGTFIFFATVGALGIALWFLWNLLIFKDPFYFAFGPYSAHTQQEQLLAAGNLPTKGNLLVSTQIYLYALIYNTGYFTLILGVIGALLLWFDKKISGNLRLISSVLIAPFIFNIIALFLGHSVLFIQGVSGDTWFNVRYGLMMMPSVAIFVGYLIHKMPKFRITLIGLLLFVSFFTFVNNDAVTIDDARVGSSQKNVSEVSGWLNQHAKDKDGFILISAASHDAIIFSSGLPMSKFIHEGTGAYWESATTTPDHWARWIVMRTNDVNDITFKAVSKTPGYSYYHKVASYPFADIYELDDNHLDGLITKPILGKQK